MPPKSYDPGRFLLIYRKLKNLPRTVHSGVFGPKKLIGEKPAWIVREESRQTRKGKTSSYTKNRSVVWVRWLSCFKQLVWVAGSLFKAAKQTKNKTADVTAGAAWMLECKGSRDALRFWGPIFSLLCMLSRARAPSIMLIDWLQWVARAGTSGHKADVPGRWWLHHCLQWSFCF